MINLDEDEQKTLHPLKIAQIENGKYLKKQGKYPVIFMTFSSVLDQDGFNKESLLSQVRSTVADAYKQHIYCYKRLFNQVEEGKSILK